MSANTWHIVGDVHGHIHQLRGLLHRLGWVPHDGDPFGWTPPAGAMLVSVGDVVDRGPDSLACLRTLKRLNELGHAELVMGNHECRYRDLIAALLGDATLGRVPESRLLAYLQLMGLRGTELRELAAWLDARPAYLELPGAVVAHAAWSNQCANLPRPEQLRRCAFGREIGDVVKDGLRKLPNRGSGLVEVERDHALPARVGWAGNWRGRLVIWGHHTVVPGAVTRIGHTVNVESGCFQGESLSAYVHPVGVVVQVAGTGTHWRQLLAPYLAAQGVLFPPSLDAVRAVIEQETLADAGDYLAWLTLECEALRLPPLPAPIVAAHRAVFERAVGACQFGNPNAERVELAKRVDVAFRHGKTVSSPASTKGNDAK